MIDFKTELSDFRRATRALKRAGGNAKKHRERANKRLAMTARDLASIYAPKRPTRAEAKAAGKPGAYSGPPGALQSSIKAYADEHLAEIFVPLNSPAGSYAWKMHEEKGRTWKERGPGTVAKGAQADDKFIERAIKDTRQQQAKILSRMTDKILKEAENG